MKRKILIPLSFAVTIIAVVLLLLLSAPQNDDYDLVNPQAPGLAAGGGESTVRAEKDAVRGAEPAAGESEAEAEEEEEGTGTHHSRHGTSSASQGTGP